MRPIDADALCEVLKDWRGDADDIDENDVHDIVYYQAMSRAIRISEGAPTLDYAPVRHGEWVDGMKCQYCGQVDTTKPNYCPNCGAKMDGGKEDG